MLPLGLNLPGPLSPVRNCWAVRWGGEPDRSGLRSEREVRSGNNCADSFGEFGCDREARMGQPEVDGVQGKLSFCLVNEISSCGRTV